MSVRFRAGSCRLILWFIPVSKPQNSLDAQHALMQLTTIEAALVGEIEVILGALGGQSQILPCPPSQSVSRLSGIEQMIKVQGNRIISNRHPSPSRHHVGSARLV